MELDVGRHEAEVEILSQGKPGRFLGIGGEPARVRVRRLLADSGAAPLAVETVSKILLASKTDTTVTLRSANDADTGGPIVDIMGDDSGLLIGRKGETLRALQFLVNLIVRNKMGEGSSRITLDIEKYRERRNNTLTALALRVADRVSSSGRSVSLEPMSAAERRVVHVALSEHPRVTTQSTGMGEARKVTIAPKTANT